VPGIHPVWSQVPKNNLRSWKVIRRRVRCHLSYGYFGVFYRLTAWKALLQQLYYEENLRVNFHMLFLSSLDHSVTAWRWSPQHV
jgi:hypothetical protein